MKKIKTLLILSIACMVMFVVLIGLIIMAKNSIKTPSSKQIPAITQPATNTQKEPFIIKGSIPYWDQDSALSSFTQNVDAFDYINLFWYYLSDNGAVEKYKDAIEDKSIISFARANKVKVIAVITNLPDKRGSTWDSSLVENVIKNKDARVNHINNIIEKIDELDFDGVTIDYEEVEESQREKFSLFIKELSNLLHQNGKIVAVALHPKTSDSKDGNGEFQDWETLAQYVDQLNIMAYGEHWDESSAGPIASIGWVEKIIKYSKSLSIHPQKFVLGVPLYGYDWNKDHEEAAEGLTYKDIQNLLAEFDKKEEWDSQSFSPYFLYDKSGDNHEVWFENSRSVMVKIELAKKSGFAGVTFWRLGGEDQKVWPLVNPTE